MNHIVRKRTMRHAAVPDRSVLTFCLIDSSQHTLLLPRGKTVLRLHSYIR